MKTNTTKAWCYHPFIMKSMSCFDRDYSIFFITALILFLAPTLQGHAAYSQIIRSPWEEFKIVRTLGSGMFSTVYLAEGSKTHMCALKEYKRWKRRKDFPFLVSLWEQCEREYRIGQLLAHPNIVEIKELFYVGERPYLVMGYINGKPAGNMNLRFENIAQDSLSLSDACCLSSDLCNALGHAYSLEHIYIDYHEKNILIGKMGLFLVDVGSFLSFDEALQHYDVEGTIHQIRGAKYTEHTLTACRRLIGKAKASQEDKDAVINEIEALWKSLSIQMEEGDGEAVTQCFLLFADILRRHGEI